METNSADLATRWLNEAAAEGFTLPPSYIVFDLETTGLKPSSVFITETGHVSVTNSVPNAPYSTLLGWPRCPQIHQGSLRQQIAEVEGDFKAKGNVYAFPYDRLYQEGADPIAVVEIYHDLFTEHQTQGGWFATHNGSSYDTQVWQSHFRRYLDSDFCFDLNRMVDTGLIEKAIGLSVQRWERGKPGWVPLRNESLAWFYYRTYSEFASGYRWGLSKCMERYGLDKTLDMQNAHNAGFDCTMVHLLIERFRTLGKANESV
jgi:hypothetical protein